MPGQHALLSPSAAHRWMNCTAAPRLEAAVPDSGSAYAQEGTLAHAICAHKIKTWLGRTDVGSELEEITALQERYYCGEMDEYTDTYKSIILEKFAAAKASTPDARLLIETRLDFTDYIPDAFGTADAIIIADGLMEVIDFKYGKGVKVSAEDNPQMKIYALGAYLAHELEYRIERVRMTIVQPRIDNISGFEMTAADLLAWAEAELKPKAAEAYGGNGVQNPGEWCRFCKVKSCCRALADMCVETAAANPDPRLVGKADMEAILPRVETIRTWLAGIEEYALQQALAGTEYSGFKVVAGRSNRKITDPEKVLGLLEEQGYGQEQLLKKPELLGLTDLEKLIGRKRFAALCADYITKPQGRPTLVPASDKRPAHNSAADDFKDITF